MARPKFVHCAVKHISFSTTPHSWLYLPNEELTLDLEANEVEVKVLTSLASVTGSTASTPPTSYSMSQYAVKRVREG